MKKTLLLSLVAILFMACSKSDDIKPQNTKQGVELEFVTTGIQQSGEQTERPYQVAVVMVWKAEGKEFVYNQVSDGEFAYDTKSKKSFKADYSYTGVSKKAIDLPAGKYFVTIVTSADVAPRAAWSFTNFTVKANEYLTLKKNMSGMESLKFNEW